MAIDPGALKPLISTLERLGYSQFSAPGDRHGSWEWPFYKNSKGLTQFVIFAATPEAGNGALQTELWIGAQADQGFVRKLAYSQRTKGEDLAGIAEDLARQAERAARQANALRPSDLIAPPLTPRDHSSLGVGRAPRRARR
jgi:hypothetical protein